MKCNAWCVGVYVEWRGVGVFVSLLARVRRVSAHVHRPVFCCRGGGGLLKCLFGSFLHKKSEQPS